MLDSGAFSAWRRGVHIDMEEYAAFARKWAGTFHYAVALDVIPGVFGGFPSMREVERAAEQSYEQFMRLVDMLPEYGLERIIPVYHQGEDLKHLDRLVKAGAKYIGISPTNGLRPAERLTWSREVLKYVPPGIKTHAFGFTLIGEEEPVGYWSMDSSSWAQEGGYGWLLVPAARGWDRLHVSNAHWRNMEAKVEEALSGLKSRGFNLPPEITSEMLRTAGNTRGVFNLLVRRWSRSQPRLYCPVLVPQMATAIRLWSPQRILASFWFLRMKDSTLLRTLTQPLPPTETIIQGLYQKREYRVKTASRRGEAAGRLPGLT